MRWPNEQPPVIPPAVLQILRTLQEHRHAAFIVGGAVRDSLLGKTANEWDITTAARPEQVQSFFEHTVPTGIQHGTVLVIEDGLNVEVTTFRGEGPYLDGRHPSSVEFLADIAGDLKRRDFTVNAMAFDPLHGRFVDLHGGVADLNARIIRTVGDPLARFTEDGLRPLRAVRFATVLDFSIDPATQAAIPATLPVFQGIAWERLRDDFSKLILAAAPSRGLKLLHETGLLAHLLPELLPGVGFAQNKFHAHSVFEHLCHTVDAAAPELEVRLAALLHDVAKPQCALPKDDGELAFYNHEVTGEEQAWNALRRLRYSNELVDTVCALVRQHMFFYTPEWSAGAVRRFLKRVGPERLDALYKLRQADVLGRGKFVAEGLAELAALQERVRGVQAEGLVLKTKDLAIGGQIVMRELQIPAGPEVGVWLNFLLEQVLEDPALNTPEKLSALLHKAKLP